MIPAILFVAIALLLCACALLAMLGVGQLALSSVDAIERDGLARGQQAPSWSLADSAGVVRRSPPTVRLQLIVFADHSLKSFPSVAAGLRELRRGAPAVPLPAETPAVPPQVGVVTEPPAAGSTRGAAVIDADPVDLEIVILTRGPSEIAESVLGQLGLAGIPVLTGLPARYADYNVRVMPFAIFVDSAGRVRASSLVNHDWQLRKLSQIAALPLEAGEGDGARSTGSARARRSPRWPTWPGQRSPVLRPPAVAQAPQPPAVARAAELSGTAV